MPDLAPLFEMTVDPGELMVRGTVMYWFLFMLLRFVLRRDMGAIGVADILLLVIIADAAQNAMSGSYESITDGCILVGTIAFWNWLMDKAAFYFEPVRRLMEARPVTLVRDGKVLRRNLRREMITTDELSAKMRENGVGELADVKLATMESDGEISVVKRGGDTDGKSGSSGKKRIGV